MTTEPSLEAMTDTLKRAAAALRDADVPFLLAGSFATWARGAAGSRRHDLDFVVRPEDADTALHALEEVGFRTEKPPEDWLYKAWDEDILVDIIFDAAGLEISDEVIERGEPIELMGLTVPVMALEDIFTTKLHALKEHALDYQPLLEAARALREQVDWDEVRRRSEDHPYAKPFFVLLDELGIVGGAASSSQAQRG